MSEIHPFLAKIHSTDPNATALIYDGVAATYAQLFEEISAQSELLQSVPKGSCVGILGDFDLKSVAFLLANLNRQNIIAPFANKNELESKLEAGQIDFLFENARLQKLSNSNLTKHEILRTLQKSHANGLVLFSSGSTGKPKAVVHNLDNLLAPYLAKAHNPTITISVFLPDHIAGIDVLFSVLATGGTLIVPKSRTPQEILLNLQNHKVEILPASPSLLRLLQISEMNAFDLSALKLVVCGSEKMSQALLESLQKILPQVRFKLGFGTSETNAIKTKNLSSDSDFFKFINAEYKIINGELYLKTKTQALGYLNVDNSAFDEDGFFATGDLVEVVRVGGEEFLRILGRSKELINVGGEKLLPSEVEGVLLTLPFVKDCLVYGETNAITGQSVAAKIVLNSNLSDYFGDFGETPSNLELKRQIRKLCKDKLAPYKIPTKVEIVQSLALTERFKKARNLANLSEISPQNSNQNSAKKGENG